MNTIAREAQPAIQRAIFRKHLEREIVSLANVFSVAGKRDPAKRSFAFAEERTNVLRNKTRYLKRVLATRIKCLLANVVAVIKRNCARAFQRQHGFDVPRHRLHRTLDVSSRIFFTKRRQLHRA